MTRQTMKCKFVSGLCVGVFRHQRCVDPACPCSREGHATMGNDIVRNIPHWQHANFEDICTVPGCEICPQE